LSNTGANPDSGRTRRYRPVLRPVLILVAVLISCGAFYTTAFGLLRFLGSSNRLVEALLAVVVSLGIVLSLVISSWSFGAHLSSLIEHKLRAASLRQFIIVAVGFIVALQTATFFSFVYYYEILYIVDRGLEPQSTELIRLAIEGLIGFTRKAWLALAVALVQNLLIVVLRAVAFRQCDEHGSEFALLRSVARAQQERVRSSTSLVESIAKSIKQRTLAMATLAGIGSVYCFFMFKDANALAWILLGCAAWGGMDVVLMSRRLSNGRYGDADFELRELIVPLVARIKDGSEPGDPDRIFPDRAAEQAGEVPRGLTVRP
jgi:hypothetical protein